MKKILYIVGCAGLLLASCSKEPRPMTRQEMTWRVDSLTAAQNKFSQEEAQKDLERRIKIEVKVKADSILNERLHPTSKSAPKPWKTQPPAPKRLM